MVFHYVFVANRVKKGTKLFIISRIKKWWWWRRARYGLIALADLDRIMKAAGRNRHDMKLFWQDFIKHPSMREGLLLKLAHSPRKVKKSKKASRVIPKVPSK